MEQDSIQQNSGYENRGEAREDQVYKSRGSDVKDRDPCEVNTRQNGERGPLEEALLHVVRASLNIAAEQRSPPQNSTPERVPASQRLGLRNQQNSGSNERNAAVSTPSSRGRTPVSQRLGLSIQMNPPSDQKSAEDPTNNSRERVPASLRLGDQSSPNSQPRIPVNLRLGTGAVENPSNKLKEKTAAKRKPGRPPGRVKVPASPSLGKEATTKRRRVQTPKTTNCRRKLSVEGSRAGTKQKNDKQKGESSRPATSGGNTHSSDNIPLSKMLPKTNQRKADFRIPSAPVP